MLIFIDIHDQDDKMQVTNTDQLHIEEQILRTSVDVSQSCDLQISNKGNCVLKYNCLEI